MKHSTVVYRRGNGYLQIINPYFEKLNSNVYKMKSTLYNVFELWIQCNPECSSFRLCQSFNCLTKWINVCNNTFFGKLEVNIHLIWNMKVISYLFSSGIFVVRVIVLWCRCLQAAYGHWLSEKRTEAILGNWQF